MNKCKHDVVYCNVLLKTSDLNLSLYISQFSLKNPWNKLIQLVNIWVIILFQDFMGQQRLG